MFTKWHVFFFFIPNMVGITPYKSCESLPENIWQNQTEVYYSCTQKKEQQEMRQSLKLGFCPAYTRLSVRWSSQQVKNDRLINTCILWKKKYSRLILKVREHCSPKYQKQKKNNEPEQRK